MRIYRLQDGHVALSLFRLRLFLNRNRLFGRMIHGDIQQIQQEHKHGHAENESPYPEEMLRNDQYGERIKNRQMRFVRHELWIHDIGLEGVQDGHHNQDINYLGNPTDAEGDRA